MGELFRSRRGPGNWFDVSDGVIDIDHGLYGRVWGDIKVSLIDITFFFFEVVWDTLFEDCLQGRLVSMKN